jgi:hypothetical protein
MMSIALAPISGFFDHVARKTCLFAIGELRRRRDKQRQAAEARRLSSPPKPSRSPEIDAFLRRTFDSRSSGAPPPIIASLGNSIRRTRQCTSRLLKKSILRADFF